MSLFLGLLAGGLLGAYWTRPGGWLGGVHGHVSSPNYAPAYYGNPYSPYGYAQGYPYGHTQSYPYMYAPSYPYSAVPYYQPYSYGPYYLPYYPKVYYLPW